MRKGGMILNSVGKKSNNKIATSTTNDNNNNNEEEDCAMLEAQAEECLNFLKQVKSRHREIADETRQLQKRIKQLKVQLPKLTVEIEGCNTTRMELTRRIPDLKEQSVISDEDVAKLRTLNGNVNKCKSDMAQSATKASRLEEEVAKLQKAIVDAGGPTLKRQ